MSGKKWLAMFLALGVIIELFFGLVVVVVDPYFHYHAPLSGLEYKIDNNERYMNNGIVKNFAYDALITGTSHTENFKTSEFDELFGCTSVKAALSGAQYKEIAEQMSIAIRYNENLKSILFGITYDDLLSDKDSVTYKDYPTYLYDDDILNDYKYVFSGAAVKKAFETIKYTLGSRKTTTFDEYANWMHVYRFGKESVLSHYQRPADIIVPQGLTEEEKTRVIENVNQNMIQNIAANPDITFYLFLSPHSIVWWDMVSRNGKIIKYMEAEELFVTTLLEYDNVKLFSFLNNYDLVCDLESYKDKEHYSEDINSQILVWIRNGEYQLTKENKDEYFEKEREFYLNYDYDAIFE